MNRYAERVEDWFHNGSPKPKQYPVKEVIQGVPLIRWVIVAFQYFQVAFIEVILQGTRAAMLPDVII